MIARSNAHILIGLAAALLVVGCATPDLKPFAKATAILSASVKTAGDLAINQLAAQKIVIDEETISLSDTNHPAVRLQEAWKLRRETMDAVVDYSASLAAIADAAAKRKANAEEIAGALGKLASYFPQASTIAPAGVTLVSKLTQALIEVKASHDLARAVNAAHPVVEHVGILLEKDFERLETLYKEAMRDHRKSFKDQAEEPRKYYEWLLRQRANERKEFIEKPNGPGRQEQILTLDRLIAGVEPQVAACDREIAAATKKMAEGVKFYREARNAVSAWLKAHEGLCRSLKEHRALNLQLLISRTEELQASIENLRKKIE